MHTVGLRALGEKREEALERRAEHVVLEVRLRSAGLPIEELPGPPIFSPGMSIQERSDNAMRLVWAGTLGEKTGPPKRDP